MAKSNRILALEDDVIDITELPEMNEDDLFELQSEALEEMQLNSRALESIEITLDLCSRLKNKPNLSMEDIGFFRHSLDLSLAGLPYQNSAFSAAMESSQDPREVVIAIEGAVADKLQSFSTIFKNSVEKMASLVKYQFSFFNKLEKKLQETIKQVELSPDTGNKTITLRLDRWMCYGENKAVTSFSEYMAELNKANVTIEETLKAVTAFNDKIRFIGLKMLLSLFPAIADVWGAFKKTAATVFSLVLNISKLPGATKFKQTQGASYYETNTLLGLFKIISVVPKSMSDIENTEDPSEDATRQEVASFLKYVDIGIETQRFDIENKGSVTFENVSKADVLKMLRSMQTMAISYQEFNKLFNRLANLYQGFRYVKKASTVYGIIDILFIRYMSYRYRLVIQINNIMAGMMGQTYKIANNTLKKGIEIGNKY